MRLLLLGLRLAVAGGRETLLRQAFTVAGVGIGTTLLLLALTGQSAIQGRAERIGWQDAAYAYTFPDPGGGPAPVSADGALFLAVSDYHDGDPMTRAYVAALGDDPPVPPGLDRLPGPGEVAVSPAMRRLLESTPDDQLDDRFPGRVTMTIGDAGLAHRDERVALIGRTPDQLRGVQSVQEVRSFAMLPGGYAFFLVMRAYLLMGALLLLLPVLIFIVMATRVSAAHREQRLAAIRLAGATRRQTAVVAATETGLAAAAGVALAWAVYEGGRRILAATVQYQGGYFFLDDVAVTPLVLALVLVGVPALGMLTTIASLNRVQLSPLGARRRTRRASPTAWNAVPLVVGVCGIFAGRRLDQVDGELTAVFSLLTVAGLVLVGPWLCLLVSRGIARIARRAPGLIAARRIAADPRATFRAVIGVVLAAMTVTFIASTTDRSEERANPDAEALRPGVVEVITGGVPEERIAPLLSDDAQVDRYGSLVVSVLVPTDGTTADANRVRTKAANLVPNAIIHVRGDVVDHDAQFAADLRRLTFIACLFVLLVTACSLVAATIGGLIERRRPFALLHASGVGVGELRLIVFLETAATMVVTTAVGVGLGLAMGYVAVVQTDLDFRWPGVDLYAVIGAGVLAALLLSTLALPLLKTVTRHNALRFE